MVNYNSLFYLYLLVVLLLLIVFTFFVSIQLKVFVLYIMKFVEVRTILKKNINFSCRSYQNVSDLYLMISNYFSFLSLSEFYLKNNETLVDKKVIYLSLGFVYSELSLWHIAEYYYLQALSIYPEDKKINLFLAKMYYKLGYIEKAESFYNNINKDTLDSRIY